MGLRVRHTAVNYRPDTNELLFPLLNWDKDSNYIMSNLEERMRSSTQRAWESPWHSASV